MSDNIVIANFMGWINHPKHDEYLINKNKSRKIPFWCEYNMECPISEFIYNQSWDWLMPVVEYIESLNIDSYTWDVDNFEGFSVDITNNRCMIYANLTLDPIDVYNEKTYKIRYDTKIEAVFNAVVEFINVYNELNEKG